MKNKLHTERIVNDTHNELANEYGKQKTMNFSNLQWNLSYTVTKKELNE